MEKNKEKNNKKKKAILGCLFGILGAGAVATAIAVPLCLMHKSDEPIPSKHGYTVKGKEHKVTEDGKVTLTITCDSKDVHTHTLKNIVLMINDEKAASAVVDSRTMENNEVKVEFTNLNLNDGENIVSVQFTVDDSTEIEVIKNVIITKEAAPTQIINLTNADFDGDGSWIYTQNQYNLTVGTRVNAEVNTSLFSQQYAESCDDFLICLVDIYTFQDHDITKTTLSSVTFGDINKTMEQYSGEEIDVESMWCEWNVEYYNTVATFSFTVNQDLGETNIALSIE